EIDRKIKESVKEVVTASVQHAIRAPLHARFKDLPTSDIKEILLQRMLEENYDKGHEDHKMVKQDSPKTPPGSPPSPPPSGASGAFGTTRASDSAQDPPPPPPSLTTNRAFSFVSPPENSLLSQTGDIGVFIDWFCKKQGITELTLENLEGPAYEVVKAFHPDVIHLQFQIEECYKLLTNQVDEGLHK
ncbi:hypothetical protein Tco_0022599, partial [Tanacetum coccineum]